MSIIFENQGEIDMRSVSTFGVSVKDGENPIGYFGTGLKYGIAVLLRTGHEVTIQSGEKEFPVLCRTETVRGKEFGFVYAGDMPLGFTTELGKNWEVWMAYRELFCNAKDESGKVFESKECHEPVSGLTRVIVEGKSFVDSHLKRDEFLLSGEPDFKLGTLEVRYRPSRNFFYRGVKVMEFQKPAMFTYNETRGVTLTEDRSVKDPYSAIYGVARAILEHAERPMLEKVLMADDENIESVFDYHGWTSLDPGRDFFPTVAALQRDSLIKINKTALRLWREKAGGFIDPRRIKPTKVQLETLKRAIKFCESSGFMLGDEYPILVVESLGEGGTLAIADMIGKQIFLTERLFQEGGTKRVARALIEEYLHLKYKMTDCSREMQNFLFDKMVSLAEEMTGEPI